MILFFFIFFGQGRGKVTLGGGFGIERMCRTMRHEQISTMPQASTAY